MRKLLLVTLGGLLTPLFASVLVPAMLMHARAACSDDAGQGVDWQGCRKRNLMLSGNNMDGAVFSRTNFTSTDMRNSSFVGANFYKSVLQRVSFAGSSVKGADFEKASGNRVNFANADLTGASFTKSELHRIVLTGANLTGANFSKSEIGRAQMEGATIGDNDFSYANVARADLTKVKVVGKANFTGTFLFQTRIEGLDFSFATGLAQWQVDMTCGDDETVLPEGLNRPANWPCQN